MLLKNSSNNKGFNLLTVRKKNSPRAAGFASRLAKQPQKQFGFSLIELLVVVAIIAILMALGATSFTTAQKKARDTQRKADLQTMRSELEKYYADGNQYPSSVVSGATAFTCADNTFIDWGSTPGVAFTCAALTSGGTTKTYLNTMPRDPQETIGGKAYCYKIGSNTQSYTLYAKLEVVPLSSDPNYQNPSSTVCGGSSGYNYKISSTD